MFIGASLLPAYFRGKVDMFVALAPIVRLDNTSNKAFIALSQIIDPITKMIKMFKIHDLTPRWGFKSDVMGYVCKLAPHFCVALEEGFFDWNSEIDNASRYPDFETHSPSGSGWRNFVHYG